MVRTTDTSILRWGGLAGAGGGVLLILVFGLVIGLAGPEPAGLAGPIDRFPQIRWVRTVENGLYLAALALWVPLRLTLYRSLRSGRPAPALFGSALGVLGIGLMATGAIPHVVTSRLPNNL
ncbi:hypothetical protein [Kitasatospora sp. KL5]|uniref:hypothetical protein n=1 Tax=Kitasatospora sp. KL5 TaxID=3425125 RepID=UPI003D6F4966